MWGKEHGKAVFMQSQDIVTYLAELGQELHHLGVQQPIRILLIGGHAGSQQTYDE
jgi:hypothetical protein